MRWIAVGPADRFRVVVVTRDVAADLPGEIGHRSEDATREEVSFDLGKPQLNLIEPRGVRRREVQLDAGMRLEKRVDLLSLVRREIVDDDMDLASRRLRRQDVLQEVDERRTGMARNGLTDDFARAGIERGVQRERAVPVVFKAMAFGTPR